MMLRIAIFLTLMGMSMAWPVYAHEDGASHEERRDGYFIDVGYSPAPPRAGTKTSFDFNLLSDSEASSTAAFTDIWVSVARDSQTIFAGPIANPVFGPAGFLYVFPEAGTYQMYVRFQEEGQLVTETNFDVVVANPEDSGIKLPPWLRFLVPTLAVLAALLIVYLSLRKFKYV